MAILATVVSGVPYPDLLQVQDPNNELSHTSAPAPVSTPPSNQAILQELQLAVSETDRLAVLLPDPADPANLTFTFVNNTVVPPTGGTIALASVDNFPALDITQLGMAIGFVNPCGLNVPRKWF